MRVFVYGSLMRGFHNHKYLAGSRFVGASETVEGGFEMREVGGGIYPQAYRVAGSGSTLKGEVYEVDDFTLLRIDRLEGHPWSYCRTEVEVRGLRTCQVYLLGERDPGDGRIVAGCDWRAHKAS